MLFGRSEFIPEGAGVSPDTPRKKGLARLVEIMSRDLDGIFLSGSLALLACVPAAALVGNARPGTPGASIANGPKRGSEEYAALHRNASWWRDAGFDSVWAAMSAKCWHNTAHQFRDGKRVEVAA